MSLTKCHHPFFNYLPAKGFYMLQYYTSYPKSKDQWYKVVINFHVFHWMIDLIANSILALKSTRMSYVSWNKIKRSLRKNVPWIQELILTKKDKNFVYQIIWLNLMHVEWKFSVLYISHTRLQNFWSSRHQ